MDYSLPGSSVHGILQARILEWIAISFSRGSFQPRDQTQVSHTASRLSTICTTREAHKLTLGQGQLANWNDLCSSHPIPALKKISNAQYTYAPYMYAYGWFMLMYKKTTQYCKEIALQLKIK